MFLNHFIECVKKLVTPLIIDFAITIIKHVSLSHFTFSMQLGVIGTGWITEKFIDAARRDERYKVVAVCSRSLNTAKTFAEKNSIPNTFDDLEKMLNSGLINCVYIGTPNAMHYEQVIKCLSHSIAVICEKPIAGNYEEACKMVELAREKKVPLMEAMRLTCNPVFLSIKENLKKCGKIHKYVANFCQLSSKLTRFQGGEHFSSLGPEMLGGALMDIGCYTIYPMIVLFGVPKNVVCVGTKLESGVDGEATILASYDDMTCVLISSKNCQTHANSEICGELGTIEIDKLCTMDKATFIGKDKKEELLKESLEKNDMVYEAKEFADVVLGGKLESELNPLSASLETMKILDEARKQIGVSIHI